MTNSNILASIAVTVTDVVLNMPLATVADGKDYIDTVAAGLPATRVKTAGTHGIQRAGESLATFEARKAERRMANAKKMRDRRNGVKTQVMHEALGVMLSPDHRDLVQADAVRVVMPQRFQGRIVAQSTQAEIIESLTTRFSQGFSKPRYKVRTPSFATGEQRVFDRLNAEQALYHAADFVRSKSDVLHNVYPIDATKFLHTPCLQNNHDVIATMSESLAVSGLQADGEMKARGIIAGSVKLSNLFKRETVGYFVRDDQGELKPAYCKVMVSSETGNSYIVPDDAEVSSDSDMTPQYFNESCTDPSEYKRLFAADVTAPQHQAKRDNITATVAANTVRATVTLYPQYMRAMVYGPLTLEQSQGVTR